MTEKYCRYMVARPGRLNVEEHEQILTSLSRGDSVNSIARSLG